MACPCLPTRARTDNPASTTRSRRALLGLLRPASTCFSRQLDTDELVAARRRLVIGALPGAGANYREPGALFWTRRSAAAFPVVGVCQNRWNRVVHARAPSMRVYAASVQDYSASPAERRRAAWGGPSAPLNFNRFFLRSSGECSPSPCELPNFQQSCAPTRWSTNSPLRTRRGRSPPKMRAAAMSNRAAILRCCLVGALLLASAVPARGISVRSSSWHMPVVGNLLVSEGLVSAAAARDAAPSAMARGPSSNNNFPSVATGGAA